MSELRISVRTSGGALGLQRLVEVADGQVTVSEKGAERTTTLAPEQVSRLEAVAGQVAAVSSTSLGDTWPDVADAGGSEIAITDGEKETSLRVAAGSDAPSEVWDLLELVEELCEPG